VSHDAGTDCGGRTGNPCGDGAACMTGTDCQSGLCTSGKCTAPPATCEDGKKDGQETDVDCGGHVCAPCGTGKDCKRGSDCASYACAGGTCRAVSATDGVKNDSETDVDCGGTLQSNGAPNPGSDGAPPCAVGQRCLLPSDCAAGVCSSGPGSAPGSAGADAGDAAAVDAMAAMGGAGPLFCQAASPSDGVQNDSETSVDCGGGFLADGMPNGMSDGAPPCQHGETCVLGTDCAEGVCNANEGKGGGPINCPVDMMGCKCQVASDSDGVKNDSETDVDCGGGTSLGSDGASPCAAGLHCAVATDCASFVCVGGLCQAATCFDGVKNGAETDADCGGGACAGCTEGKSCILGSDCASRGCNYASVCVGAPSCTAHNGGDTCGPGESDQGVTTNEDCCLAGGPVTGAHGTVILDKYRVTSGRMRAFLTAVNGNVRAFIQAQRAVGFMAGATMEPGWDLYLPTAMDGCDVLGTCAANELSDYLEVSNSTATGLLPEGAPFQGIFTSAYRWLGSALFDGQSLPQQGCNITAPGTHTYYMDATVQSDYFGDVAPDQPQTMYDTKALNCVPYLMAQAFCIWDGGRLEFEDEYTAAVGVALVSGANPMPWSASGPFPASNTGGTGVGYESKFPQATDASLRAAGSPYAPPAGQSIEYANWYYSYEYPELGPNNDYVVFISAPGRLLGRGPGGHADLIGDGMEITSDVNTDTGDPRTTYTRWTANGSWEGHQWGYYSWNFTLVNRYGKQGLRCARPVP